MEGCDFLVSISLTSLNLKELEKLNSINVKNGISNRARIMSTQKGYRMHIKSTHFVAAYIFQPNQEPVYLMIEVGWQQIRF